MRLFVIFCFALPIVHGSGMCIYAIRLNAPEWTHQHVDMKVTNLSSRFRFHPPYVYQRWCQHLQRPAVVVELTAQEFFQNILGKGSSQQGRLLTTAPPAGKVFGELRAKCVKPGVAQVIICCTVFYTSTSSGHYRIVLLVTEC